MGGHFKTIKTNPTKCNSISRKERRKQSRKEKRAKRNEYYLNKTKMSLIKSSSEEAIKDQKKGSISNMKENSLKTKVTSSNLNITKTATQKMPTLLEEQNKLHAEEIREKANLERRMIKQRKKALLEANVKEDKEIKKIEKQLKLNKRKSKSVPKSFIDEGLDYLLEVCDSNKLLDSSHAEINYEDSEFQDDFALITGKSKRKLNLKSETVQKNKTFIKKSKIITKSSSGEDQTFTESHSEGEEMFLKNTDNINSVHDLGNNTNSIHDRGSKTVKKGKFINESKSSGSEEDIEEDFNEGTESDQSGSEENEEDAFVSDDEMIDGCAVDDCGLEEEENTNESKIKSMSDERCKQQKHGLWEDIYGRLRDEEGNVINDQKKGKYIPPHLQAQQLGQNAKKSEETTRLKKQLKGLTNRLAESNMRSIAIQIDELYLRNSRNDMNDSLLSLFSEVLVTPVLATDRLVMEHALLIAVLHANVGMEIGAHFVEAFVLKFNSMYKECLEVENKVLDNVLLIISHLYNFKVCSAVLLYNILDLLVEKFSEKDVELILLVLRSVGFSLRKDDPLALKDLVLRLQKKASEATELRNNIRVKFMLDILLAVKNNNMAKIPQYDPSLSEHLKKLLKSLVHKGKYVTELKVTLDDFLKVEERGRWWIVGSAWTGAASVAPQVPTPIQGSTAFSQSVLELARKQRMNTDTRRNIFCILMSAEDYMDAFEKLLRLGLKAQQEQEIFHVLVHCLQQERGYNPYYAFLASHFCQADRKQQMTIQYLLWDKFKELSSMSQIQISNLAKFLSHLILEKALPISILKVMRFSEMDKPRVRLLRQVLLALLLSDSEEGTVAVFKRVSRPEKLYMFRESLRLFLHHFVLRNADDLPADQAPLLKDRVRLAEKSLTSVDTSKFV